MARRFSTQKDLKKVEEDQLVQGRLFWLPPKENLPSRAVRRAHGKGAVEDGIYNHPVVIASRPACESNTIHFQIITSFQGKRLHEIYSKSNDFHASRRSWYLPISPSPDHPDASSKKTRRRFPKLDLADGAVLRWDSYLNIRHVYKIDWSHLRPYSNPDTPERHLFSFDRESTARLLAKSNALTNYEPGPQYSQHTQPRPSPESPPSPPHVDTAVSEVLENEDFVKGPSKPELISDTDSSISSSEYSALSPILQPDFSTAVINSHRNSARPPKEPPDGKESKWEFIRRNLWRLLIWPLMVLRRILAKIRSREDAWRDQES